MESLNNYAALTGLLLKPLLLLVIVDKNTCMLHQDSVLTAWNTNYSLAQTRHLSNLWLQSVKILAHIGTQRRRIGATGEISFSSFSVGGVDALVGDAGIS